MCREVWAMSRPWQRNEETPILVFNLPPNQPRLGLYSPIYLILITLDKMPSMVYSWNILHKAQVARRWLHWADPLHNEESTPSCVIIKFTHHTNTHHHHPVTPLKSLWEREEYEEIQNKENKLAHMCQLAECRDARASTPEERVEFLVWEPTGLWTKAGGHAPLLQSSRLDFRGVLSDIIEWR